MSLMLSCEETAAVLSDYEEGILPLGQFLKVKVHLYTCPACRALLATLRALPVLMGRTLGGEEDVQALAQAALRGALARLGQPSPRPWPGTPVPAEVRDLLSARADRPLRILAAAHDLLSRDRQAGSAAQPLPQAILDQLPPAAAWSWEPERRGLRRAELLAEPAGGQRLLLVHGAPGARFLPHRHQGSDSILVLQGAMEDAGRTCLPGDWIHHPAGSVHAPRIPASGCWALVREEGAIQLLGPVDTWRRTLGSAS